MPSAMIIDDKYFQLGWSTLTNEQLLQIAQFFYHQPNFPYPYTESTPDRGGGDLQRPGKQAFKQRMSC